MTTQLHNNPLTRNHETQARIETGTRVRDRVSGVEGVCIGVTDWLDHPETCIIQPRVGADGKFNEPISVPMNRCEVTEERNTGETRR